MLNMRVIRSGVYYRHNKGRDEKLTTIFTVGPVRSGSTRSIIWIPPSTPIYVIPVYGCRCCSYSILIRDRYRFVQTYLPVVITKTISNH